MSGDVFEQALTAHRGGQLDSAEILYAQLLQAQPDHPDALALYALVKQAKGHLEEALSLVNKAVALDPRAALFRLYQGQILLARGDTEGAAMAYRGATNLAPDKPEGYCGLGKVFSAMGAWDKAGAALQKALSLHPDNAEAWNSLGLIHYHFERLDEALDAFRRAVSFAPAFAEGWLNLCNLAEQKGFYEESCRAAEAATRLQPDNVAGWFGYGVALNRLQRDDEALVAYQKALALNPLRADLWDNLAQTYQFLNRIDEAHKAFLAAVEADNQIIDESAGRRIDEKEYGNRHWHLALIELLRGDYLKGFARYRARFHEVSHLRRLTCSQPVWQGEDIAGKTILVLDEQGMGDCLMMMRYLPLMKQRGARVTLTVYPALVPLFKQWEAADKVVVKGADVGSFDMYATIFDLPYAFGTTVDTIPAAVPYLPSLPPDEKTRLEVPVGKRKVGVVWGGSPLHKHDNRRSVPLSVFSRLFDVEGIQFYNLNRDKRDGDEALLARHPVIDLTSKLDNFADAARLIDQMDLVISCDSANAHLAGGMGKPVWTMLPFAPDWRWLMDRSDSPWYPTMRLFRQPRRGDWEGLIADLRQALVEWARKEDN